MGLLHMASACIASRVAMLGPVSKTGKLGQGCRMGVPSPGCPAEDVRNAVKLWPRQSWGQEGLRRGSQCPLRQGPAIVENDVQRHQAG
eukprot:1156526-Pelagomonas_calceolata.AAC.7